jgi:RNA recognition motif-containing protein
MNRGFAIVEFESIEAAVAAYAKMSDPHFDFGGTKNLRISWRSPDVGVSGNKSEEVCIVC